MKQWIDRYVRQTPIEVWIYVAIFGIIGFFYLTMYEAAEYGKLFCRIRQK